MRLVVVGVILKTGLGIGYFKVILALKGDSSEGSFR